MAREFSDFLEAKFDLDERSLNADVRRACIERIAPRDSLRWLDVGSGTGAMVRRLLRSGIRASEWSITALDRDPRLLDRAAERLAIELAERGCRVRRGPGRIDAEDGARWVRVEFRCGDVLRFEPSPDTGYDLVTAHAFMDIVPMASTLARFARWLARDGLLYATLNYDGDTALFPLYDDEAFERDVLARYDESMELRRVDGQASGGARSGRRLHRMLCDAGFDVVAFGSSDWNITPSQRRYRNGERLVLAVLLDAMRDECRGQPHIDVDRLATWHRDRSDRLDAGGLGAIIHQLDLLALRVPV